MHLPQSYLKKKQWSVSWGSGQLAGAPCMFHRLTKQQRQTAVSYPWSEMENYSSFKLTNAPFSYTTFGHFFERKFVCCDKKIFSRELSFEAHFIHERVQPLYPASSPLKLALPSSIKIRFLAYWTNSNVSSIISHLHSSFFEGYEGTRPCFLRDFSFKMSAFFKNCDQNSVPFRLKIAKLFVVFLECITSMKKIGSFFVTAAEGHAEISFVFRSWKKLPIFRNLFNLSFAEKL